MTKSDRKLVSAHALPAYQGERYQAEVPDTLDLAERAALALNGIGGTIDPDGDYQMWIEICLGTNPPYMLHGGADAGTPEYAVSMPLMRVACGSDRYLDIEQGMFDTLVDWLSEDDGLLYTVYSPRRPWHVNWKDHSGYETKTEDACITLSCGAMMLAMLIRQQMGDPAWEPLLKAMARGLESIAIDRGDYAYYPDGGFGQAFVYPRSGWMKTDEPGGEHEGGQGSVLCYQGYQLRAMSLWAARTGDEQALEFAGKLARFVMKPQFWGGVSDPTPSSGKQRGHLDVGPDHARTISLRGLLEYGLVVGDPYICDFVRTSYEYMRSFGIPETGFIPTSGPRGHLMEACLIGDNAAMALKLSLSGYGDYWEDVDRLVRNQMVECQLADRGLLERIIASSPERKPGSDYSIQPGRLQFENMPGMEYGGEDVLDRALGTYSGGPHYGVTSVEFGRAGHCCTANATSGMYYAWESITRRDGDNAQVNLFLNRAAPWLDVDSHLPYEGRVVITNKTARRISVRIPPWVDRSRLESRVNGEGRRPGWVAGYAVFDELTPGDAIELSFPLATQTISRTAYSGKPDETTDTFGTVKPSESRVENVTQYTIRTRANTVLDISPKAESPRSYPFYQRDHLKRDRAPMKTVTRFVAPIIPEW